MAKHVAIRSIAIDAESVKELFYEVRKEKEMTIPDFCVWLGIPEGTYHTMLHRGKIGKGIFEEAIKPKLQGYKLFNKAFKE
jgi:hypothetical protein